MARSTRKSLAGTAAAAARKVMGRGGDDVPASGASATETATGAKPAKKTATKAATKAPAKKATTKAPAKKTTTKAPAKKTTTKAPAKKTTTKAPAKKTAAKKTPAKRAAVDKTAVAKTAANKTTPTKKASVKKTTTTPTTAPATKVAKKAPVSALVVKEGEGDWTRAELDEVLAELHGQRDKLVHVLDETEHELAGLMKDAGDGAGQDQADMGATSFERDHELTVLNIERDMLAQIDRALGHIDDGSYGVCESCEQPIGKMRLMAFPRATLCMTCKQREERR